MSSLVTRLHGFPSMDALTTAAASGMKARMESLEMLANNLANQASAGYKSDREFYSLYISPEAVAQADATVVAPPVVPVIERHWTDFSQGTLAETGNPLHLALSGRGFFQVAGPDGPLYTRNGSFHLSRAGRLETQEGYPVLTEAGQPVTLDPAQSFEISSTGEIRQANGVIARLGIVDFAQPQELTKRQGTYFQMTDNSMAAAPAREAVLVQGRLESANQAPSEAAVRLITVLRQFEMLQKAVQIGAEMGRRADEIARVNG